jgi:hypothetical protein
MPKHAFNPLRSSPQSRWHLPKLQSVWDVRQARSPTLASSLPRASPRPKTKAGIGARTARLPSPNPTLPYLPFPFSPTTPPPLALLTAAATRPRGRADPSLALGYPPDLHPLVSIRTEGGCSVL